MTYRDEFRVCAQYACGSSARLRLADGILAAEFDASGQYVPRVEFLFREGRLHLAHSLATELTDVDSPESRICMVDSDTGARLEVEGSPFRFALVSADGRTLCTARPGNRISCSIPPPREGRFSSR